MRVEIRRVYDAAGAAGDYRVLVDRLWPRGVTKASLGLDEWDRDIAPSTELRQWFGHDPERWDSFRRKYLLELKGKAEQLERLRTIARKKPLTLLYSAKDQLRNQAAVLREALLSQR